MDRGLLAGGLLGALAELRWVRFVAVGLCNTFIFFAAFWALVGIGVLRWIAVSVAFATAVAAQYLMQGVLTFRRKTRDVPQIVRFLISVAVGLAISEFVMLSGPKFQIPEIVSSSVVVISVALWNWLIFNIWVFAGDQ